MDIQVLDSTTHGGISVAHLVAFRALTVDEIQKVKEGDKKLIERALRVMSRVRFADHLRFAMPLSLVTTDIKDALEGFDRDDLEVYLLCTCLDTLAGRDAYIDFSSWTRTSKETFLGVKDRESFLSEQYKLQKTFNKELYGSVIQKLLDIYQTNYGVTKNIHLLIELLPENIKREIVSSYTIYKANSSPIVWERKSTGQKIRTIIDYLLDCRRHQYTHSAQTAPTFGEIRAMRKQLVEGIIDIPKPEAKSIQWGQDEYKITCHYGDESFLLREIIFACLAQALGVLDEDWIIRSRETERQRRVLYALIYELDYNLKIMQLHLGTLLENFVILETNKAPHFRVNIAKAILAGEKNTRFQMYIPRLNDYIEMATKFNKIIDDTKVLDKVILGESEFRWLCPMLRGYCNNLLDNYPEWVYNKDYIPDFSV